MDRVTEVVARILRRERAPKGMPEFTDRASDRGGPTKYGITQRTWDDHAWRLQKPTLAIRVRDITEQDARDLYAVVFVSPLAWIDNVDLLDLVADCSVNHGPERAARWLQSAVGVAVDGVIGPVTRVALQRTGVDADAHYKRIYNDILRTRLRFYARIASDQLPIDPDLPNLRGWIERACGFIR